MGRVPPHGARPLDRSAPGPIVDDSISITLTRTQVKQIMREAQEERGVAAALSGLGCDKLAEAYESIETMPGLSRSLLVGLLVLRCFPPGGGSRGVKEVAEMIGTKPSNAHRYITTLVAAGLLERDPCTRRYHLPQEPSPLVSQAPGAAAGAGATATAGVGGMANGSRTRLPDRSP